MTTYGQINSEPETNLNARMLRAAIGVGVTGTFLTGIWVSPAWIFTASVLAIYFVTSAILNKSLIDAFVKSPGNEAAVRMGYQRNRGNMGRVARGATAGVALGSVLGDAVIDAYALEAIEIFMLNVGGVLLAMTTLFGGKAAFPEIPAPVMAGSPSGTGLVTEPDFGSSKRAA